MASAQLTLLPPSHITQLRLIWGPHAAQCLVLLLYRTCPHWESFCVLQDTKELSAAGQHSSRDSPYPDVSLGQVRAEQGAMGAQQHTSTGGVS